MIAEMTIIKVDKFRVRASGLDILIIVETYYSDTIYYYYIIAPIQLELFDVSWPFISLFLRINYSSTSSLLARFSLNN